MASAAPPAASESPHGQALAATPGRPPTAGGDPHAVSDLDDDADSGEEDDGMPADMASLVRDAVSTGSGSASATPTPGGASNTPKQRMQDLVSWYAPLALLTLGAGRGHLAHLAPAPAVRPRRRLTRRPPQAERAL